MRKALTSAVQALLAPSGYQLARIPEPRPRWPDKSDTKVKTPTILIFTPPNSGSTAMSNFLTASKYVSSYYATNNEMQWLVPGLSEPDRWWPEKPVCYRSVSGVLQNAAQAALKRSPEARYLVEKSPPNMVRYRDVIALFETPKLLVNNRNPYANISSQISRYSATHYQGLDRPDMVRHLAEIWIYRSRYLAEIAETYDVPILTYETFCDAPSDILKCLDIELDDLAGPVEITVKDYAAQGIINMNGAQMALLRDEDIDIITETLSTRPDLMELFGYSIAH